MTPPNGRAHLAEALRRVRESGGRVLGERLPGEDGLPLSEGASVALATGLALAGRVVVVELVDLAGIPRAADALADAGGVATRSGGAWTATVVVLAPLAAGDELPAVPAGVRTTVVGRAEDVGPAVAAAAGAGVPTVLLLAGAALDGRAVAGPAGSGAEVLRAGRGVSLLALGEGVPVALAAAEALAAAGVEAEVVDLRGPVPDAVAIGSVKRTGRPVFVGHGGVDVAALVTGAFWRLEAEPRVVAAGAGVAAVVEAVRGSLDT